VKHVVMHLINLLVLIIDIRIGNLINVNFLNYDAYYREYAKSPACDGYCLKFKNYNNPIESCDKPDYVDEGPTGNSSSDATTTLMTSQIVLFSLIMCLIFTLFL